MNYDVLTIHEARTSLKLIGSSVSSLKNSNIERHGVRRFENGKLFQASRVGSATTEQLLADSREWGGAGIPYDAGFAPVHQERRQGFKIEKEQALESFQEACTRLIERFPGFVFSGECAIQSRTTSLQSDYGLDLEASGDSCQWYLAYQRKGSGNMIDGYIGDVSLASDISRKIEEHGEFLEAQTRKAKLSSGPLPVLLVESTEAIRKLIESVHINRYKDGSCLLAGRLGEQLFSPAVSLVDRIYDPNGGTNQFFDGEGTVRESPDVTLVEQGRFSGLISNLRFAAKYGQSRSSGNGVRSYNTGVTLAPHSLRFLPGTHSWREIVGNLDRCLLAVLAAGGDSNDLGEFSTPVQIGYVFERGELIGLAPQVTVKTSVLDYLGKDLIAVASDDILPAPRNPCVISAMNVMTN